MRGRAIRIVSLAMGLVSADAGVCQSLDIRLELRNQMRYLEVQRDQFDSSFLGMQVKMYSATKDAEDYLVAHRLDNPIAVLNDPDDDHFGPRLYKLIVSLGKSYRDAETKRIDSLRDKIEHLNSGFLPGYLAPSTAENQHGQSVLHGVSWAEDQLKSYSLSCDSEEWMHQQIQSTISRADDIEAAIRKMYQAQEEEERRRAQRALEEAKRRAEEDRQRLAQALREHPTPDDFQHDHRADTRAGNNEARGRADGFPLDKHQRDMIGGLMQALDRETHKVGPQL